MTVVGQSPAAKRSVTRVSAASIARLARVGDGIALLGAFSEELTLGADAHRVTLSGGLSPEVFLALVRGDGSLGWALRAGSGSISPGSLAALADGLVVMSGTFWNASCPARTRARRRSARETPFRSGRRGGAISSWRASRPTAA